MGVLACLWKHQQRLTIKELRNNLELGLGGVR